MSHGPRILYDEDPVTERTNQRWLPTVVGALIVAMLVIGPFDSPEPTPAVLTTPTRLAIAAMPDLTGSSLIAAGNRLSAAGLDRSLLSRAQWIANSDTPAGVVTGQSPAPGTAVFDEHEIEVILSSGGPTIGWNEVPPAMRELIQGNPVETDEPVLVVETAAGPAYKTDHLLFGGCRAVDLTRDTFFDRAYTEQCPPPPVTTIGGWLGDGAMYAIAGLPAQDYLDVASAISLGPDEPLGRQLWSSSQDRKAPVVEVDGQVVRVIGGHHRLVLRIPLNASLNPAEVASLITPIDIRGDLVVALSPPLAYYDKPGLAGNGTSDARAARRHREVPGEPFSASPTVNVVSGARGLEVIVAERYANQVEVLAVPATAWSRGTTHGWQYAFPTGWREAVDPNGPEASIGFSVSTADLRIPSETCGPFPVGALHAMGSHQAWVTVSPTTGPAPDWPIFFGQADFGPREPQLACLEGVGADVFVEQRTIGGQTFSILMAFGSEVSDETRHQAVAIVATFEPTPRYPSPEEG